MRLEAKVAIAEVETRPRFGDILDGARAWILEGPAGGERVRFLDEASAVAESAKADPLPAEPVVVTEPEVKPSRIPRLKGL